MDTAAAAAFDPSRFFVPGESLGGVDGGSSSGEGAGGKTGNYDGAAVPVFGQLAGLDGAALDEEARGPAEAAGGSAPALPAAALAAVVALAAVTAALVRTHQAQRESRCRPPFGSAAVVLVGDGRGLWSRSAPWTAGGGRPDAGSLCPARSGTRWGARRVYDPPAADSLQPLRPEEVGFSVRHYELMVILDPELEERTIAPSLDRFLTVITKAGGSVGKVDIWGRRRLAYEIKKQIEGIYAVIDIDAEPAAVSELDRQLNLNESVLRTKLMRPEVH